MKPILAIAFSILCYYSHACSCLPDLSPIEERVKKYQQVFLGQAISAKLIVVPQIRERSEKKQIVKDTFYIKYVATLFTISNSWKGIANGSDTITITTRANECCSCPFDFDIGLSYYVFASEGQTSSCSITFQQEYALFSAMLDWCFYKRANQTVTLSPATIANIKADSWTRDFLTSYNQVRFAIPNNDELSVSNMANPITSKIRKVKEKDVEITIVQLNHKPLIGIPPSLK